MRWRLASEITFQPIHFDFSKVTYERKVDPLPILIVKIVLGIFGFIMNLCVLLTLTLRLKYRIYIIMMTLAILSWTVVDCILCYQTGIINSLISF
ncbi:unnamed protein product, partial [Trichobilharzia szidati]